MKNKILLIILIALFNSVLSAEHYSILRGSLIIETSVSDFLEKFKNAIKKNSIEEIKDAFNAESKIKRIADATIVLYGENYKVKTQTDKNGNFIFKNVPYGSYELLGIYNKNGQEIIAHKNRLPYDKFIYLKINSTNTIEVEGKVINKQGVPLDNIDIKALLENKYDQSGDPLDETWNVKTNKQGKFLLKGVLAPNLRIITGALKQGNLSSLNSLVITAINKTGNKKTIKIKPVSQITLKEARYFLKLWDQARIIWNKKYKGDAKKQMVIAKEKDGIIFPKSNGNKIFIDIILDNDEK